MHLVKVYDNATGNSFMMDADMQFNDAGAGIAFYLSQLSVLDPKIYETKYQNIMFEEFIPVDSSDPEWVDSVTYISYDAVTMGKFIGANAKDLPSVSQKATKSTIPVFYGGIQYDWSLDELRKSVAMRMPLDVVGARMAVRGYKEHKQKIAYFGDDARGITGLFNNANVPESAGTIDFSTATGQEMVDFMNDILNEVYEGTAQVHVPNVLLVPQNVWKYLTSTRMDSGTDTTVLQFFLLNNMSKSLGVNLVVKPVYQLNDYGTNSTGRFMAYELNSDNLVMKSPMPLRALAPQAQGLGVMVPCEYKFGGVEFRYPMCAYYMDMPA